MGIEQHSVVISLRADTRRDATVALEIVLR